MTFASAASILVGGVGLLTSRAWGIPVYFVAAGMLIYTLLASPWYYVQKRGWPMVAMFAVLLVVALTGLAAVLPHALA